MFLSNLKKNGTAGWLVVAVVLLNILLSCRPEMSRVPAQYRPLLDSAFARAGENAGQLREALKNARPGEKEAVAFLISYMPDRDLRELSSAFILENVKVALQARREFPWAAALPDSVFLNEVLPYASLNERRDNWRADFYERFSPVVKNCKTLREAVDSVNRNIREVVKVEYNTRRQKADQSPYESMEQGMASCTGLSILLTDAFRAVGIPSRIAGTPLWTNLRGNHNWCEVWIDGQWYFTEYYPDALNKSWFLADAGKADPEKPVHWIYASSFKPGGTIFPCVWDSTIRYVPAENVTDRYISLYRQHLSGQKLADDELILYVSLYSDEDTSDGNARVSGRVAVTDGSKELDYGYTAGPRDDLNKLLAFTLKKNSAYTFVFAGKEGQQLSQIYRTGETSGEIVRLHQ